MNTEVIKQGVTKGLLPFKDSIPSHIDFDVFVARAVAAIVGGKDLVNCNPNDLDAVVCRAALDGVYLDGREAAILCYKKKINNQYFPFPQYICMVDGVLSRVRMSGEVKIITAKALYDNDSFDYYIDENGEHIKYKPAQSDRGNVSGAFAYARLHTGELIVEYMTLEDILAVKGASKTSGFGPWVDWFDRMAVKSVMHRLMRKLPHSSGVLEMLESGMNMNFDKSEEVHQIVEFYPEQKFIDNLPAWTNLVSTNKKTVEDIITTVESKGLPLTDEQLSILRGTEGNANT